MEKSKLAVHNLVQKVGFFGILACASVSITDQVKMLLPSLGVRRRGKS